MEALSFEAISSARPLLFRVGPKKREFFIHSALVASLSPSLKQLVDGPWAESTSGIVDWDHVDEATFVHFCQFAYTSSYDVQESPSVRPEPEGSDESLMEHVPDAPEPAPEPAIEVYSDDPWDVPSRSKKKKKPSFPWPDEENGRGEEVVTLFPAQLQSVLHQALDKQPRYRSTTPTSISDKSGVTACYSYGEIFLAHIRVCLFADYHQIDDLSNQALERLRWSFMNCQVEESDVIEATERYVKGDLPDGLRGLVLAYIASQATRMWDHDRFQALLQEDAGMAFELLKIVMEAAKA